MLLFWGARARARRGHASIPVKWEGLQTSTDYEATTFSVVSRSTAPPELRTQTCRRYASTHCSR